MIALPVLPVGALGPVLAVNPEQGEQVGWRELTASVAQAWAQAGPDAVIFTRNYGQAGAVERYGPEYGLPQPYSGHMSYGDWGPPPDSADGPVVVVGPRHPLFTGCLVVVASGRHRERGGRHRGRRVRSGAVVTGVAATAPLLWLTVADRLPLVVASDLIPPSRRADSWVCMTHGRPG